MENPSFLWRHMVDFLRHFVQLQIKLNNLFFFRRDDPTFDEQLAGCHLVSSCSNIADRWHYLYNNNCAQIY